MTLQNVKRKILVWKFRNFFLVRISSNVNVKIKICGMWHPLVFLSSFEFPTIMMRELSSSGHFGNSMHV